MAYPTSTDYFKPGDWNALCSMCGAKRKASQLVKNWQGQWRCPEHNEPRQPQDFVRSVPDNQSVPWSQAPANKTAWYGANCVSMTSIAKYAVAGCAIAGSNVPYPVYPSN